MSLITDNEIKSIVKKHMSFAIFLVVLPIIFIQLIAYFSGDAQLNNLLFYIVDTVSMALVCKTSPRSEASTSWGVIVSMCFSH